MRRAAKGILGAKEGRLACPVTTAWHPFSRSAQEPRSRHQRNHAWWCQQREARSPEIRPGDRGPMRQSFLGLWQKNSSIVHLSNKLTKKY